MRLASVLVALAGCGTDFDVDQAVPEQQVQGSGIPAPLAGIFPLPLNLDLSAEIQKQHTGPIDSVTLSSLTLSITATDRPTGDSDDWSFVDEIHVFVSAANLPKVEIASVMSPGAVDTLHFAVVHGVDLKPYVDAGSTVDSSGKGTIPSDDVSYAGKAVFTVHPL